MRRALAVWRGCVLPLLLLALAGDAMAQAQEAAYPDGAFNPYERLPIRVYLDETNLTKKTEPLADEFERALDYWERGGNGRLSWQPSFERVSEPGSADIVAWFVDATEVPCGEHEGAAGCGSWGGPAYEAQGTVSMAMRRERYSGEAAFSEPHLSFNDLRNIAMHELGHALGLPHSSDPADVMSEHGHMLDVAALSPDTPWFVAKKWSVLGGFGVLALAVLGIQRIRHAILRPSRQPEADAPTISTGGAQLGASCERSPTGEHRFEVRHVVTQGESQEWMVCRDCRYPRRR